MRRGMWNWSGLRCRNGAPCAVVDSSVVIVHDIQVGICVAAVIMLGIFDSEVMFQWPRNCGLGGIRLEVVFVHLNILLRGKLRRLMFAVVVNSIDQTPRTLRL